MWPFKCCRFIRAFGTLSAADEPLHFMSLRFRDRQLEQGYVRSCSAPLSSNVCIVFSAYVAFAIFNFVFRMRDDHGVHNLQLAQLVIIACTILIAITLVLLASVRRRRACISDFRFERIVVIVLITFTSSVLAVDKYNLSQLLGVDSKLVLERHYLRDSMVLLSLDAVVTIACLAIPIRWFLLWTLNVFTASVYPISRILLMSAEADFTINSCVLIFIIVVSSVGKYKSESKERRAFLTIITEKTLRCEAEHQLERRADSAQNDSSIAPITSDKDDSNSAPTTTNTGRIFREPAKVNLSAITTLGIKEHWLINTENLQIYVNRFVGAGGFGHVSIGSYLGAPVAVKAPRDSRSGLHKDRLSSFMNELRVLRQVRHPNLVGFYGACISSSVSEIALVIEFVAGLSLDKFLFENSMSPGTSAICTILLDTCCALRYLHQNSPRIVHADLKCSNVLLEFGFAVPGRSALRAKLCDFGLSRIITRNASNQGGTLAYQAPELLVNPSSSPSTCADIFSFGRVAFAAVAGRKPLASLSPADVIGAAEREQVPDLAWPQACPLLKECKLLCERCLKFEPSLRQSIEWTQSEILAWTRNVILKSFQEDQATDREPQASNDSRKTNAAAIQLQADGEINVGTVAAVPVPSMCSMDLWVWIDVSSTDFPIVCCSDRFQTFGNIKAGTCLANFIAQSDWPSFLSWSQSAVNMHANNDAWTQESDRIFVTLCRVPELHMGIRALCSAWEIDDDTEDFEVGLMCIVFHQLKYLNACTRNCNGGGRITL